MKAPDHPEPSGDRTMARMLLAALEHGGHRVELACRLRSYDGTGDPVRQQRLRSLGGRLSQRLVQSYRTRPPTDRPDLWFTYHLYHKAPDWLGPPAASDLGIPYVVAEASHAAKQASGPWAAGHAAAKAAIARADLIVGLNPADDDGLRSLAGDRAPLLPLPPFIDCRPWAAARVDRVALRETVCGRHGPPIDEPLLVVAAMMRHGDKLASYRLLGDALAYLREHRWRLLVAGDGPARAEVEAALVPVADRIVWLGRLDEAGCARTFAAADLYVWPAIGEAWGMALLEAQAAGLPVVAGRTGGVPAVVRDGATGLLVPAGDARAFARAVAELLGDDARRRRLGEAAAASVRLRHDIAAASRTLDAALSALRAAPAGKRAPA